jgi:hypothetical protein
MRVSELPQLLGSQLSADVLSLFSYNALVVAAACG